MTEENKTKIHPHFKKVIYDEQTISNRIKELAQWVDETYKDSQNLILVGILKGSMPFMAELMRNVTKTHAIDFIVASSYGGANESSGSVKIVLDLAADIRGKDVLLVEDIIESGITINKIVRLLKDRKPNSIKTITLIDKPFRKETFVPEKSGFLLEQKVFLVGFGLDYQEKLRNVPYVGEFNQDFLNHPDYDN
ncbi:hypoxanthine phosphoribosyltransferase [Mycoplasmopsis agassizii]|uniref:Hypoxanthine phosphoribosyltransferase n=1 Tax=Mycoplasmopsis agassizii TaxID=33922 RepID=A0ABX4H467_9BACT|nr:hypoxanthine phosphoribosyltransferase [Mycoplasmopsis agassizii]PAF54671.1 hypoxanthine phosphoribosyltransferase [Mycoplasmopsis agassizii]SMC16094.1 hypoxanthine phosphoribosyltransferase [Mycoplasmopsis agassizii]